jgi:hypothetical protein
MYHMLARLGIQHAKPATLAKGLTIEDVIADSHRAFSMPLPRYRHLGGVEIKSATGRILRRVLQHGARSLFCKSPEFLVLRPVGPAIAPVGKLARRFLSAGPNHLADTTGICRIISAVENNPTNCDHRFAAATPRFVVHGQSETVAFIRTFCRIGTY